MHADRNERITRLQNDALEKKAARDTYQMGQPEIYDFLREHLHAKPGMERKFTPRDAEDWHLIALRLFTDCDHLPRLNSIGDKLEPELTDGIWNQMKREINQRPYLCAIRDRLIQHHKAYSTAHEQLSAAKAFQYFSREQNPFTEADTALAEQAQSLMPTARNTLQRNEHAADDFPDTQPMYITCDDFEHHTPPRAEAALLEDPTPGTAPGKTTDWSQYVRERQTPPSHTQDPWLIGGRTW